ICRNTKVPRHQWHRRRFAMLRQNIRFGLLSLLLTGFLLGQSDRGTITGTVLDPGSAAVPNATLTLKSTTTGATYQTITTGMGNFTLPSLPSGIYSLTVGAPGFNQYVQEGIQVQVAQTARVDLVLKIGATSESVTVQANAPLLR